MKIKDFESKEFKAKDQIAIILNDGKVMGGTFEEYQVGSSSFTFYNYATKKDESILINSLASASVSDDFTKGD